MLSSSAGTALRGVWARGIGINGALGTGSLDNADSPTQIHGDLDTKQAQPVKLAAGFGHSAVLDDQGRVYLFGRTHDTRLTVRLGRYAKSSMVMQYVMRMMGVETSVDAIEPKEVLSYKVYKDLGEDDIEQDSRKRGLETKFEGYSTEPIREVVCGAGVTAFITKETDTLFVFGENVYGQCATGTTDSYFWDPRTTIGLPEDDDAVASVALGFRHGVVATKVSGKVFAWGKGQRGQLGIGLRGIDDFFVMQEVRDLPGPAIKVAAGMNSSAALLKDGRVFVWGKMQSRQLDEAKSNYEDQVSPREVEFGPEAGPVLDIWAGPQSYVALVKDSQGHGCKLYQWGLMSDKETSSSEAVTKQIEPFMEEGFWKSTNKYKATARTVLDPVPVFTPFELSAEQKTPQLEVTIGTEGICVVGEDLAVPYVWDWNLRPVPLQLHDPTLASFISTHGIKSIAQGWQHTLFLSAK